MKLDQMKASYILGETNNIELKSIFPAIYFHPSLVNVGSESAKSMGKQSGAKRPETSAQQLWAADSRVSVISWSRNWPNCITIRVACKFG